MVIVGISTLGHSPLVSPWLKCSTHLNSGIDMVTLFPDASL